MASATPSSSSSSSALDDVPLPAPPRTQAFPVNEPQPSSNHAVSEGNIASIVQDKVEALIRQNGDEKGAMRLASVATLLFKIPEIKAYFSAREFPPKKGKWIVDIVSQESTRFGFRTDGPGLEEINLKGFVGKPRDPNAAPKNKSKFNSATAEGGVNGKPFAKGAQKGNFKAGFTAPSSVEDTQSLADAMESVMQQSGKTSQDVAGLCLELHRNYPHFREKYPEKFGQIVLSVAHSNPRFRVSGKLIIANNGSAPSPSSNDYASASFDKKAARPPKQPQSQQQSGRSYATAAQTLPQSQLGAAQQAAHQASSTPSSSSSPVQHRQLYPIYPPYYFSDVPTSLPFTIFETSYTVELEIATFGLEVKNVSFGSRALRVDLQQHKNLSQAYHHQPLATELPSLLVFISPDEFAEVISFVPGSSSISIRFVRKN